MRQLVVLTITRVHLTCDPTTVTRSSPHKKLLYHTPPTSWLQYASLFTIVAVPVLRLELPVLSRRSHDIMTGSNGHPPPQIYIESEYLDKFKVRFARVYSMC